MELNHIHCQFCVKTICFLDNKCKHIFCPFKCGAVFHECKLIDHKTICPQVAVECLNAGYGCPYKLYRKNLGHHLEQCPASVVLCNMKWVREVAAKSTEIKMVKPSIKIDQLDAALALKDQITLSNADENYSRFERPLLIIPNKEDSIMNESICSDSISSKTEVLEGEMPQKNMLTLSLESRASTIPEVVWKSKKHVFMCSELLQRSEFPYHYLNFHSEMQGECGMWLEQRCPLSMYGCCFSQHRLKPKNGFVSYNPHFNQLGIGFYTNYPNKIGHTHYLSFSGDYDSMVNMIPVETIEKNVKLQTTCKNETLSVSNMPDLPFKHILWYLDSFSIKNLSITSRVLQARCQQFIYRRGIVVSEWQKIIKPNGFRWQIVEHKWIYSNCPSEIRRWQFADNCSLSNHLNKCPFNVRISHTKPELIPRISQ